MFHRECPRYEEGAQSCPHYQLAPVNAIHTLSGTFKATVAFSPLTCGFEGCKRGDIQVKEGGFQGNWVKRRPQPPVSVPPDFGVGTVGPWWPRKRL